MKKKKKADNLTYSCTWIEKKIRKAISGALAVE